MELFHLFITSLMPVLKVLLVIAAGSFLATDRIGLLGADARSHLNNLVFYVFFPALIGCSIADTITIKDLAALWFMPVNIIISCVIGSGLGLILVMITRTPRHLWGIVIACSSAGNLGNMLLIILPALCEERNSPFKHSSTCSADGKAYASLSLAIQATYVWSIVYFIIRMYANHGDKEINTNDSIIIVNTSVSSNGCSRDVLDQVDLPHQTDNEGNEKISTFGKLKQSFVMVMSSRSLKKVFAPSTIAAIVGFIIGIASPVRKALIGDGAPLRVIFSSAELIGEAGIPSITLIVGANLLKGLRGSGVGASVITGIIVIRNILLPASGIAIVKAAKHFGMVNSGSFYKFTLLLQYAMPPAMNIGTISQMLGAGESEFSVITLWSYVIATFSVTLWTAFYMWLVT
ncbi:hypothetical protein DITRI_Ditri09bG0097700 [Diplodiscus trichospermus]